MSFVSCLCVATGPLARTKASVRSWAEQTHARRELLIGAPSPRIRRALERFVDGEPAVSVTGDASLGELARRGAELACPWPPASTSHPERLAIQLRERERAGSDVCSLLDWIAAHPESRELMWCHSPPPGGAGLLAPPAELLDAMRRPAPGCPPAVGVEGVPLVAVRCVDEHDWRAVESFKRDARMVEERKAALPELLAAHRLSRPHLIRTAGHRGDVLLDPYCRGDTDEW